MIEPTESDIGKRVIYQGYESDYEGVITSFNSECVFVLYDGDSHSKATRRSDLWWSNEPKN